MFSWFWSCRGWWDSPQSRQIGGVDIAGRRWLTFMVKTVMGFCHIRAVQFGYGEGSTYLRVWILRFDLARRSFKKKKEKIDVKGQEPGTSTHAQKVVLQDKGSHVVENRERDLVITRGGTERDALESFVESLGNEEREEGREKTPKEGRRRSPARAASIAGEGGDCSTVAAIGSRLSQRKIREERGGQKPPLRGPTPPPAVGRDSLVPGRPAGGSP
ncbi:hypothetical protein Sjap_020140 [Stephania japonica]|uniref:Uncharacterized protein n=1 Tax=Stephania japonica TaxID=461633 RepID=A0AAP0I006_9MAGN